MKKINILIIGGTGFIGRNLAAAFSAQGFQVAVLSRQSSPVTSLPHDVPLIHADVSKAGEWQGLLPEYEVLINLAGASIFRRWTARARREIFDSRILTTRNIVDAILVRRGRVNHFFSVSGVGYYGFHRNEVLDESCPPGTDFLANVAARWEGEAIRVRECRVRPVICRLGHVFGLSDGVFPKFRSLARLHLASHWGSGEQWISWVHESDLAGAFLFLLQNEDMAGPVNVAAPQPLRNKDMMKVLTRLTGKKALIPPVPEFLLRLITGEFATAFVNGQRVVPAKLLEGGFNFMYPDMEKALSALLRV